MIIPIIGSEPGANLWNPRPGPRTLAGRVSKWPLSPPWRSSKFTYGHAGTILCSASWPWLQHPIVPDPSGEPEGHHWPRPKPT